MANGKLRRSLQIQELSACLKQASRLVALPRNKFMQVLLKEDFMEVDGRGSTAAGRELRLEAALAAHLTGC